MRGSADRRIPFKRVSRVVESGRVSWSTNALLECADQGVVVHFLKGNGMPRARWIGRVTERSELAQRWVDFLDGDYDVSPPDALPALARFKPQT